MDCLARNISDSRGNLSAEIVAGYVMNGIAAEYSSAHRLRRILLSSNGARGKK
jgi:hypothetical protein